MYIELDKLN